MATINRSSGPGVDIGQDRAGRPGKREKERKVRDNALWSERPAQNRKKTRGIKENSSFRQTLVDRSRRRKITRAF